VVYPCKSGDAGAEDSVGEGGGSSPLSMQQKH